MKQWRMTLLFVGIGWLSMSQSGWSCQVPHVDTAAEITEAAELIVLGEVVGIEGVGQYKVAGIEYGSNFGNVEFEILEVLKGRLESNRLTVGGQTDRYDGPNDGAAPYNFVRPGGRHGECFASDYKQGAKFLLFLREGSPNWAPLAATNEEVSGPNDPWVLWVKEYLAGKHRGDSIERQ